jgi:hypothetical protein
VTLSFVRYNLDEWSPPLIAAEFVQLAAIKYRPVKTRGGFGLPPLLPIGIAYWHQGLEAALRNRSADYASANRIYLVEDRGPSACAVRQVSGTLALLLRADLVGAK